MDYDPCSGDSDSDRRDDFREGKSPGSEYGSNKGDGDEMNSEQQAPKVPPSHHWRRQRRELSQSLRALTVPSVGDPS